jgi:hypothetical protein
MALQRYACPDCGGGLSRTLVHPKWLSLEAEKPEFQMPLGPILVAIAAVGLGLALIHPALGVVGVVLLANWLYWRYFSWLQCDACSRFFFGGQLGSKPRATRPWTSAELKSVAFKVAVVVGGILIIFLPLSYLEETAKRNCSTECAQVGKDGQSFFSSCKCVPRSKCRLTLRCTRSATAGFATCRPRVSSNVRPHSHR